MFFILYFKFLKIILFFDNMLIYLTIVILLVAITFRISDMYNRDISIIIFQCLIEDLLT